MNRTSVETPKADNEGPVTVVKSKTEETPGTVKPYHFKNEEYLVSSFQLKKCNSEEWNKLVND